MKIVKILSVLVAAAWMTSCGEKPSAPAEQSQSPETSEAEESAVVSEPEYVPVEPAEVGQPEAVAADVKPADGHVEVGNAGFGGGVLPPSGGDEPFVLQSLDQIKVREGSDSPKVGDTIYSMTNLPEEACGTYWVLGGDGYVETLAVCTGDHEH
ncbi:hypothetical protein [Sulfuriroseicoccus oceanibius]|uniref:Lipoprotein n=1 Tax=Sulfuriroseicoccus oceanibius TaxID=2707525 RepID=A0A6B3L774_9BACT|nr:hypothetical protein [Sulfuriroseicoccus oceanibius]QQL45142.1 hypothetical protein G3M56_000715 [Sulfuriroseicoccus oceanibius]